MYYLSKCTKCISLIAIILIFLMSGIGVSEARKSSRRKLTTPQGVRLLKNKSFDDSEQARKEILDLIEGGFEYVCDFEDGKILRKRK